MDTVTDSGAILGAGAYYPSQGSVTFSDVPDAAQDLDSSPTLLPKEDESCSSVAAVAIFALLPVLMIVFLSLVALGLWWPGGSSVQWLYCRAKAFSRDSAAAGGGDSACERPAWHWLALNSGMLLYVLWSAAIDPASRTGYRYSNCFRNSSFWRSFANYFPVELVGDALDLDDGPFIIGYHPHGIISVGAFAAFGTNGCGWQEGPGLNGVQPHLLTLPINFKIPFLRELLLSLGLCTSAKETFRSVLKNHKHKAVVVVVGGADESLASASGTYDLTLVKRKGFVREALIANASLVPCFGFGETDVYAMDTHAGCCTNLQNMMKKTMGFTLPLFRGRCGPMPHARKIVVVLGEVIRPPSDFDAKTFDPKSEEGQEMIDQVHAEYCRALRRIWNTHKEDKAPNRRGTLMFQGKANNRFTMMIGPNASSR